MESIVIHGAFDADNFGDVLLAELTVLHANKIGYHALVSGSNPQIMEQIGGNRAPYESWKQIRQCKALVYSGGGYWGEQPNSHLRWHLSRGKKHLPIGYAFRAMGRPIGCVGAGYGPLRYKISRYLTTNLLNSARVLALRDRESLEFFEQYGGKPGKCEMTADMALMVTPDMISSRLEDSERLKFPDGAIGIHTNESLSSKRQKDFLDKVKPVIESNPSVDFAVFQDGGSRSPKRYQEVQDIATYLGKNVTPIKYVSPWLLCDVISNLSAVITNKLHVGIIGSALGKTILAFPNHPKTSRFYNQLGRPELCFTQQDTETGRFQEALTSVIQGKIAPVTVPAEIRALSRRNYDLINTLLEGN